MAKSPKEKVIHKAMKSADKFYNEIPGNMKLDLIPTLQQHRLRDKAQTHFSAHNNPMPICPFTIVTVQVKSQSQKDLK